MSPIKYIGRKSLHFYGKYLSEISKNLKSRGKGRVVIKETETKKFNEPCFYVLDRVVPLMSDSDNVRCRAWGERIYRGRNLGYGLIPCTHEPDWRLLSSNEAQNLMELVKDPKNVAPDVQLKCTAPVPPLLAIHLRRNNCIPEEIDNNAKRSLDPNMKSSMKEGAGLLLFTPHKYDVTAFQAPMELSDEEKGRVYPSYEIVSNKGFIIYPDYSKDSYTIKRSDTPCLAWKVTLGPKTDEDSHSKSSCT